MAGLLRRLLGRAGAGRSAAGRAERAEDRRKQEAEQRIDAARDRLKQAIPPPEEPTAPADRP